MADEKDRDLGLVLVRRQRRLLVLRRRMLGRWLLRFGLLRRLLLRVGLTPQPPIGFLRDVVVERSGEHRGRLDIKRGGLLPLVNLARYGGVSAGSRVTGTVERLRIAADAGTLPRATAASLEEAFLTLVAATDAPREEAPPPRVPSPGEGHAS